MHASTRSASVRTLRSLRLALPGAALLGAFAVACGAVEDDGMQLAVAGPAKDPVVVPNPSKDAGGGDAAAPGPTAESCQRSFVAVDLASLVACQDGKGHCYAKDKTPHVGGTLPECSPTEWCVPDAVLSAGGSPLATCASGFGAGACVSTLISEVAAETRLVQDSCDAASKCVPCNFDGQSNAACTGIGVYDNACEEPAADAGPPPVPMDAGGIQLESCCSYDFTSYGGQVYNGGQCVPNQVLTPQQQQANLPQNTCDVGQTCAPNKLVAGQNFSYCEWEGPWFSDGTGVCIDSCFITDPGTREDLSELEHWGCAATEFCVPCEEAPPGTPGCFN